MRRKIRIRMLAGYVVIMTFVFGVSQCAEAEELKLAEYDYSITFLPWSRHHGKPRDQFNERHHGVGFSVTNVAKRDTYSLVHFENSHEESGFMLSYEHEFKKCWLGMCPGYGGAFAPAYRRTGHSPVIAWVQVRIGWVTIMSFPGVVTTGVIRIPWK